MFVSKVLRNNKMIPVFIRIYCYSEKDAKVSTQVIVAELLSQESKASLKTFFSCFKNIGRCKIAKMNYLIKNTWKIVEEFWKNQKMSMFWKSCTWNKNIIR